MLRVGVGNHWTCLVGYRPMLFQPIAPGSTGWAAGKNISSGLHFGSRTHVVRTP